MEPLRSKASLGLLPLSSPVHQEEKKQMNYRFALVLLHAGRPQPPLLTGWQGVVLAHEIVLFPLQKEFVNRFGLGHASPWTSSSRSCSPMMTIKLGFQKVHGWENVVRGATSRTSLDW